MREERLDLVMSGAWRSRSVRRVVKNESRRSGSAGGGVVMREDALRSVMNFDRSILLIRR